ncbi:MAG: aminotransferase class III-fold pyridoxal phosphate-dependent enzyme [Eubacteriales bacterium]|nr:aminotransferase class III-fold pyridoxal phosphate-dependent enzyme [Eubacteriales bacterium]MDD3199468.1 aminotransferase class III-fold pyridoxal phosphate-dependent enzyme [Eubacteriales bacterium]MDD4629715.1 aminotransferase class III-fold pyridoxal phosphate-dependent enzyme [Eubacteriales bacterium]
MSKIKEQGMKYNLYSWCAQKKINPMVIPKAEGIYFWDEDGKKYYDMSAQLVNSNLGHGHKKLIRAIKRQAEEMAFIGPGYSIDVRSEAAQKIVDLSGLEGAKVFFVNAGAEANENAMKYAKAYTGKWKIFAAYRSYHGASFGASSLTGEPRRFIAEPGVPGVIHFDGPYAYRAPKACKFNSEEDITDFYLELLENQILYEGPDQIAGIFFETVVGSNGIMIPPKGYYEGVRALCDKHNILMICDEVMAGFYRTGTAFAFQQFNVKPDLVTFAKGATCGYIPLGGVIVTEKIAKIFDEKKMFNGLTYSAHPMGCATAIATLNAYKEENIEDNVRRQGKVLADILDEFEKKHASVGQVRHIGLFSCVELVKSKETREPLVSFNSDPEGLMPKIVGMLKSEGFSTYSHENMILVCPPLIITETELRAAMNIMDKVLDSVDDMIK